MGWSARIMAAVVVLVIVSGCTSMTSLMFIPYKEYPVTPDQVGVDYETVHHTASDGTRLVSWWLPARLTEGEVAKGTLLFLHGNAQNMSYHQFGANWLPAHGYNVLLLGYREYGASEGLAKLPDIFLDVHAGLDWIIARERQEPIILFGQSIGGSLAVYGLASYPQKERVNAVVLDSTFDSYPGMAAEAMSRHWVSWILQLPAWMITSEYDPERWITQWGEKPLLMFHSPDDQVVPFARGRHLFELANEPKIWVDGKGKHISTFRHKNFRWQLLTFLQSVERESR